MQVCFQVAMGLATAAMLLDAAGSPSGRVTLVVKPDARTGKLVRSVVVAPKPVPSKAVTQDAQPEKPEVDPRTLREAIDQIAARHALPPLLVHSVIKVESNYNALAISNKGAQGMMQLIPATARRFGVGNAFNPVENINGGARYLRYLLDLYKGDFKLALAAYNAGEQNVARYGGIPPFSETRNYLVQVGRRLEELKAALPKAAPTPEPQHQTVEVKPVEVHSRIQEVMDASGKVYYVSR
jgi:hypothetical protein